MLIATAAHQESFLQALRLFVRARGVHSFQVSHLSNCEWRFVAFALCHVRGKGGFATHRFLRYLSISLHGVPCDLCLSVLGDFHLAPCFRVVNCHGQQSFYNNRVDAPSAVCPAEWYHRFQT